MRTVVHLLASTGLGETERQLLGLAQEMAPEHRSVFLTFPEQGRCRAFLRTAGQFKLETQVLQTDTPRWLRAIGEIADRLGRLKADVLFCHGCKANLLGRPAARRLGLPVVAVSRGWTAASLSGRCTEALDRFCLRWLDQVVCVSGTQAGRVVRAGVKPERVQVIPNAIDPDRFVDPEPRYRTKLNRAFHQPRQRIVGSAGQFSPEMGFDVLIAAAEKVIHRHPRIGFVIFGEGPCRSALLRQINSLGLADEVVLTGCRTDLDRFVPFFDLLVLPWYTEGLPSIVLEAFAAGIPVVASAVGEPPSGSATAIEDGVNGYLVAPGDPRELADRICDALESEDRLREMGLQGRHKVLEQFTFSSQADQYSALVARLCRPREDPGPRQPEKLVVLSPEPPLPVEESACTR